MTSFLFLATALAPFGEAVCGMEVASAAHAAGHRVVFLHHSKLEPVFVGAPFARGTIDDVMLSLLPAVRDAIRARSIDVLVFVDAVSILGTVGAAAMRTLQRSCGARVIALDLWSCHETDLAWDMGEIVTQLDPIVTELPCLRPCPVARPEAPGSYRALPELEPIERAERMRVRSNLGIGEQERVVFTASGAWQAARLYPPGSARRFATAWPAALAMVVRRLDATLLHVGPESFGLGDRYLHLRSRPPAEFQRLVAASDLVITNNVMATSMATSLALDVPAIVIRNTATAATAAELRRDVAPDVRTWVETALPLRPFAVMPLGLHGFLAPVLASNPYVDAVELCEILDPDATALRARALIDGNDAARAARAAYRMRIASLPSALERLRELTA